MKFSPTALRAISVAGPSAIQIFWIAVMVRAVLLVLLPDLIPAATDKADRYDRITNALLAGDGFSIDGRPTAASPPGYPALLVLIHWVAGASDAAVKAVLALLDAAQCAMIFLIARRHFGGTIAFWSGLIMAFCPYTIATVYFMSAEPLFMALHAAMLLVLGAGLPARGARFGLFTGVLLGMATLTRGVSLLLPAALAVPFRWSRERHTRLKPYVLLLCGMLALVGPWLVRNQLAFDRFVPVQTLGGFHFYADLTEERPKVDSWSASVDAAFYRAAVDRIREQPSRMLALIGDRLHRMWYGTASGSSRQEKRLLLLNSVLLCLAAVGIWRTRRSWRSLLYLHAVILYYIGIHSMMTVIFRYMLPVIPILVMFATVGAGEILGAMKRVAGRGTAREAASPPPGIPLVNAPVSGSVAESADW